MIGYSYIGVFEILFFLIFVLIFGVFVISILGEFFQWNKNNQSLRLSVVAIIISRREESFSHDLTMHSTTYFVTFEVESGDRIELEVNGTEYGMLAEGDIGKLIFQGTRYLGFERIREGENY